MSYKWSFKELLIT